MNNETYQKGINVRREVLGDQYVDKALSSKTEFTDLLQTLVTEACWGTVWTRPGLSKKIRSLVTIAMLSALKTPAELKAHVRGALRNGCTISEVQEVLAQATIYCGMSSGIIAFKAADEVIKNWQQEKN